MTIFAIDPGPHTGVVWRSVEGKFHATTLDFTSMSSVAGLMQLWNYLDMVTCTSDTLVLESFEFRKDKEREYIDYSTGEYVGVVKLFAGISNTPLVVQNAAVGKGFWSDNKIKRAGLYSVCDSRHTRDAMRHWLKYYTFILHEKEYLYKLR